MPERTFDFETARRYLAANIARLRQSRGWTQEDAAGAAGISSKHLQKLEYGQLNPNLRTLVSVASAFGLPVGRLLAPTRHPVPRRPVGRPKARPPVRPAS